MGLREKAGRHLRSIVENTDRRGGWPIKLTAPSGVSADFIGLSGDISQVIDPETGVAVSGRAAHVSITQASLCEAGIGSPEGIADANRKPWIVEFTDILGQPYKFKVVKSNPDRTLPLVTCLLELYG